VIAASLERLERELPADAVVLDVGGWAKPLARADWVLDIEAHATRGQWGYDGDRDAERFTADTWLRRDLCAREPWPFADGQFDFAVCSHTLEDLRDPVWVCSELERVARAGYVEVPAAVEELTWGVHGEWVGWSHHRWICTVADGALELVYKPHLLVQEGLHLPAGTCDALTPEQRVTTLWWEGSLPAHERVFTDPDAFDAWLAGLLDAQRRPRRRWRR
jgi:hypothetical protein